MTDGCMVCWYSSGRVWERHRTVLLWDVRSGARVVPSEHQGNAGDDTLTVANIYVLLQHGMGDLVGVR